LSHLLRLGRSSGGVDPVYGAQLRRVGVAVAAPGVMTIAWEELPGRYPSGEAYTLRQPIVRVTALAFGPLDPETRLSLRVPPAVFGLGLIEAVSEREIRALADAEDDDGDGISGRMQQVRDPVSGGIVAGRFGWKAAQPSLAAQSATALLQDLGVTSPLASTPNGPPPEPRRDDEAGTAASLARLGPIGEPRAEGAPVDVPKLRDVVAAIANIETIARSDSASIAIVPRKRAGMPGVFAWVNGARSAIPEIEIETQTEIGSGEVAALVRYLRALAVPARRRWSDPAIAHGEALFAQAGCADCHRPRLTTGQVRGWRELSGQTIRPYTDLLLHDMGPGLADGVAEGIATGREWRTPPLWGLGLLPVVSGEVGLLHDGRARSVEEAILWHAGEADRARERFMALPRPARAALIAFVGTL
jgi:CxxC motif-containing protein (DUF1111 family)